MEGISNTYDKSLIKDPIGYLDAFGRLRVSQPFTLFDSQNRYSINNKFYSNVVSNGSVNYITSESTVQLNVSSGHIIRESKNVFAYQPGKSLLILNTFVMSSGPVQRVGYFNTQNGVFLEYDGTNTYVVTRFNGTDVKVPQSQWNTNKLPGLDLTKSQIFWIDIEWLGVGTVRTGFIIDGKVLTAHAFHHANKFTSVYMTTAILPVRYEIIGTGTMKQICSSVISEGGYEPNLPMFTQLRGTTNADKITLALAGTIYPTVSIRLKTGYFDSIVTLKSISILSLSADDLIWYIIQNPTLTGASWSDHVRSTITEYDISATATSGGSIIMSGYVSKNATVSIPTDVLEFTLGRTNTASDIITIGLSSFNVNASASCQIDWIEV